MKTSWCPRDFDAQKIIDIALICERKTCHKTSNHIGNRIWIVTGDDDVIYVDQHIEQSLAIGVDEKEKHQRSC